MAGFLDAVRFLPVSAGLGDFVVSVNINGYMTPAQAGAVDATVYRYRAESADLSQWEIGYGAYTVGSTTLARTSILFSSTGGAKINFTARPNVGVVLTAEDMRDIKANSVALTNTGSAINVLQIDSATTADVETAISMYTADNVGPRVALNKSRNATIGGQTIVQANDGCGRINFSGSDGSAFQLAAAIVGGAIGTISAGVVPGTLQFYTANAAGVITQALSFDSAQKATFSGPMVAQSYFSTGANNTVTTATYTVVDVNVGLVFSVGATCTVTMPNPATYPGRWLYFKTIDPQAVVSDASNIDPLVGGGLGTAILAATDGKWAIMQSTGSFWEIMAAN